MWQQQQQDLAKHEGYVCTILGRRRKLPDAQGGSSGAAVVRPTAAVCVFPVHLRRNCLISVLPLAGLSSQSAPSPRRMSLAFYMTGSPGPCV